MTLDYIFNTNGEYVGFIQNGNLFDPQGEWLGFLRNGNELYSIKGDFLGFRLDDGRVAKSGSALQRAKAPVPPRPARPLTPLPPLSRLPMVPLLPPWQDVFEHAKAQPTRPRPFPGIQQWIGKPQIQFDRLVGASINAADGTFLGKISTSSVEPDSILNSVGNYGNEFSSQSIFNKYSNYGGQYSIFSPFNAYTTTPPQIEKNGVRLGSLTVNQYVPNAIDPNELIAWLRSRGGR